ncbi:neuronal tyrosine-phosphorylated phosphoinositide-3-kinase adapter 1 isoform X2 [Kryptolebias marmoratus]|uniref:Neuronal tyrosine phosphorylated phosphoinositide-3-kinase adaptor 1 n=2 Tax=Kryptolebias marmoratus TaxID=37003 RepID=A0A3Q3ANP0_KRYMA|nr:neuronal tyrosine-phosphorylated phosphoinositide-3-kinase adapter 1 isoform X2 [Kryptolebias marmoratus]XP_024866545.1 neuronal tyrosine-phosphorylated phosphoinositide-3-kinase adapter 1 isoform X2 [Kryptolebias marmoratus]
MSSGSAQDVAVEHFLRDIERRSKRLHCAVIGCEEARSRSDMNLLYRKSRLDWRQRDQEGGKKSSTQNDPSATVGKVRDLASFRRHFRMGFMTMPASQDLSPHTCASAMAPRSQSCHAVGAGDVSLENGDYSDTQSQHGGRCPPAKPKRHPSTRLSSSSDSRAPPETPTPPPTTHSQAKHSEKKNAMKKSDSGEIGAKKVPPLKPKRSPSTQLTFDPLPPRVPPPATSMPFQAADSQIQAGDGEDEPVYIEMVGQVFTRESQTATPHPVTPVATTPDSDSDQSEAIYEEMKYPHQEDRESQRHLPPKHEKLKSSKHYHVTSSSSSSSSSLPRPSSSSPSYSKPKATVSISHSSPLPSSASSTPVPQVLSTSPHTPRAPTPYLLQGSKSEAESNTKIPAPFPNLLQHRPPLLAFPQPAAASSGVGVQNKASSSTKTQTSSTATQATTSASSSASSNVLSSLSGSKESSGGSASQQDKHSRDSQLGPAPGLRARSHSTPLPPSSKSTSPFSHHHHHPHHRPSHYHHYRKPDRGDSPAPTKSGSQTSSQATVQTQTSSSGKEGKSVSFLLKSDKERDKDRDRDRDRERDRTRDKDKERDRDKEKDKDRDRDRDRDKDRERDRDRDRDRDGGPHSLPIDSTTTSSSQTPQSSTSSTPTPLSSSQRPHSRPHLRSHTPHGLPAYKPPSSDSPLLWTYPSGGFRRPPAYESLRGSSQTPSLQQPLSLTGVGEGTSKNSGGSSSHSKVGFMPWDSSGSLGADEGSYWPMQRKLSFSHGSRDSERDEGRSWNGSADALLRMDKEDLGMGSRGSHSGIPVHFSGASSRALGHSESLAGVDSSSGFRALPRAGLPLPCQTFPACRNGEVGRLGRSSSAAGVRQVGVGDVQRQSSLPAREALNQLQGLGPTQTPCSPSAPSVSRQQQQLQLHQQQLHLKQQLQQLQQQHHLQLQFQQLAQLAQGQPPAGGGATPSATQTQRDGKLLEVIERKRCLCKEIKAHRRPDKSLCKQDSMPILPSWRRTPEPRNSGTPPCQRPQAVVWDTAI